MGGTSLVRDSLDDVLALLVEPGDESEKVIVQMAKVLLSLSRSNTNLLMVEINELLDMALHLCDSPLYACIPFSRSGGGPVDGSRRRVRATASLAIALSLLIKQSRGEEGGMGLKQEPRTDGEEMSISRQIKQESPESEHPLPPVLEGEEEEEETVQEREEEERDPFIARVNTPRESAARKRALSPISMKREKERMEIEKKRMVGSQLEMDCWPMKRKEWKVEVNDDRQYHSGNNNHVQHSLSLSSSLSSSPSSSSSIHFRCPLSAAGVCEKRSGSVEENYGHVQVCHPDFNLPFACPECTLAFRFKHELRDHGELFHSSPATIRSQLYLHKLYFPSRLPCPHCPFSTSSSRLFLAHHSADHAPCGHSHISCSDASCRRRFKFHNMPQVIYHYGVVASCKGQCVLIQD